MTSTQLISSLRSVPTAHLKIVDLAWEVTDGEGKLDVTKAGFLSQELADAAEKAKAYVAATQRMKWSLRRLNSQVR